MDKLVTRSKAREGGGYEKVEPPRSTRKCNKGDERWQKNCVDVEDNFMEPDGNDEYRPDMEVMLWDGGKDLDDEEADKHFEHAHIHTELLGGGIKDDHWTTDEENLFWDALKKHGKNFAIIKQMLPHKKMPSLVNHYYALKKLRKFKAPKKRAKKAKAQPAAKRQKIAEEDVPPEMAEIALDNESQTLKDDEKTLDIRAKTVIDDHKCDRTTPPSEMVEIALDPEKMGQETSRTLNCMEKAIQTLEKINIKHPSNSVGTRKNPEHVAAEVTGNTVTGMDAPENLTQFQKAIERQPSLEILFEVMGPAFERQPSPDIEIIFEVRGPKTRPIEFIVLD